MKMMKAITILAMKTCVNTNRSKNTIFSKLAPNSKVRKTVLENVQNANTFFIYITLYV